MFWAWVQHVQDVLDSLRLRLSEWASMNKGAFGFSLSCSIKKMGPDVTPNARGIPGIFVGATWFWANGAKASYQICMDLDGSASSTVGGQRWSHIDIERFLHFENQDQRIANSWMRYAQPWNSPHLKHLENTTGEHNWRTQLENTTGEHNWRTQLDLKSIDKFSNRHHSCKNIRLDWADGFPLHSTWTAVRSWVESMLIDDSPLITIS